MKKTFSKFSLLFTVVIILCTLATNSVKAQWYYSGNGIPLGVVYSMTSNNNYIFAGSLFGVYKSSDNGNSWISANGGQTILFTQSVVSDNSTIFATSITNGVIKSTDYGQSWVNLGIPGVISNKISVINNNLYVGANNGVQKSSNQGLEWDNVLPLNSNGYDIKANSEYLFASTENGIYRSIYPGGIWECIAFSGQVINSILVLQNNIYAGHSNNGIWVSNDNGISWEFAGLQNRVINSLSNKGNVIFAGTEDGFFMTTDFGSNWISFNDGLPSSLSVKSIFVAEPNIFAGTNYNGIFKRPLTELGFTNSPELLLPSNNASSVQLTPMIAWSNSENSNIYRCVISTNPNFSSYVLDVSVYDTSYQVPGNIMSPSTTYYWKVKSINSLGESSWSEVFNFTTLLSAPQAPPVLLYPGNGSSNISLTPMLSWNSVEFATAYNIKISTNPNFSSNNYDLASTNCQIQIPVGVLNFFTQYYWKAMSSNTSGNGPWSTVFTFTTSNNTGLTSNNIDIPKVFNLYNNYPNPFNPTTKIEFDLPKNSVVKINVYDITGRQIKTLVNDFRNAGRYEVQFNASNLSSGIYFYKMQAGDYKAVRKMMLIK